MISSIVIAGGGITGMVTAALLSKRYPEKSICLIEQSERLGGLYSSICYPRGGYFDYGMHILYDSGIEEVDNLLHALLPPEEWHILEGNRKDIAGIFYNGKLQEHSPYLDLRHLPADELKCCIQGVYLAAQNPPPPAYDHAKHYFETHFGEKIAAYWQRVIEKLYDISADQISVLATREPSMNRVIIKEFDAMAGILRSPELRARIAFPDQLQLPPIRNDTQRGWYPKRFGMIHLIKALERYLLAAGVTILLGEKIERLLIKNNRIQSLCTRSKMLESIDRCYWTGTAASLAALFGTSPPTTIFKRPYTAQVNLRFAEPPRMGALYQSYIFDPGYRTFRITNYANYCPAAKNDLGYPICLEYWPKDDMSDAECLAQALSELRVFGIIGETAQPSFSAVERLPNRYDMFVYSVDKSLPVHYDIDNLIAIGLSAENGQFLFHDLIKKAYPKIV